MDKIVMMPLDKPKRVVSQAPLKETQCFGGCGATVQYRTTPRVYCEKCGIERKRASARATAEKQRRMRGVVLVKGTEIACSACGRVVVLNRSASAKFCKPCALEASRTRARAVSDAKPRAHGRMGAPLTCRHCRTVVSRESRRQTLCGKCRLLNDQGRLPNLLEARQKYRKEVLQVRYREDETFRNKQKQHQLTSRARRKLAPSFSINERMSAGIRGSLIHGKQGWRWEALVGFTLADLMRHLERQFLPGMTWENRGDWHIDHVVPISSFAFKTAEEPEFRAGWALSNLRPLWALDNLKKNAIRTHLI